MAEQQTRVVAELGRPETPQETADRKAASRAAHRNNQTTFNLVLAIIASLGIVLFLVFVVVRPSTSTLAPVDYTSVAAQSQASVSQHLVVPQLPKSWSSNSAQINQSPSDGITTWYIGFITPDRQYIGLTQGISANPTWVSNQLKDARQTGETEISGITWTVYDQRTMSNSGNYAYSLAATLGDNTYVLNGTASTAEFRALAAAVASNAAEAGDR